MDKEQIRQEIIRFLRSGSPEVKLIIKDIIEENPRFIFQNDIFPDTIKSRMISEGVRFIRAGVAADRPTSGEKAGACYFSTDTDTLNIWNGSSWVQEVLT